MKLESFKRRLDCLYIKFNRKEFLHPDPLELIYNYKDQRDREIVGLIASSLAYGRVEQILKSISWVLVRMGDSPVTFLESVGKGEVEEVFKGFVHRFATGEHLCALLISMKKLIEEYGSLYRLFLSGMNKEDETILEPLNQFTLHLIRASNFKLGHLIPIPDRGSQCKRLNLFLRWMVRKDEIDPGGWDEISASKLVVPLDTHLHAISMGLGLTCRRHATLKTALEITEKFKLISPEDPVKYDFTLTRFGIRRGLTRSDLLSFCVRKS
jgi:uncharacterized protein (TIGR02757 family)